MEEYGSDLGTRAEILDASLQTGIPVNDIVKLRRSTDDYCNKMDRLIEHTNNIDRFYSLIHLRDSNDESLKPNIISRIKRWWLKCLN